jgi:hypothetical protein
MPSKPQLDEKIINYQNAANIAISATVFDELTDGE